MADQLSVQQRYAPQSRCFGCGPANEHGLRIESRVEGDALVADWLPAAHHEAFDGVLNGGIIGALLDCHSNWAAAMALMVARSADRPPGCVTAEYAIRLLRPTPTDATLRLVSRVVALDGDRVTVDGSIEAGGRTTATSRGVFVAVPPGHPAYDRW